MPYDIAQHFRQDLPAPAAARFGGFPRYNFVGGHNDASGVPVDAFVEAASKALTREGRTLATYGMESGPQGYRPLRTFVADMLGRRAGMSATADDVLVVSGSLQALDLVNAVLVGPGDTVVIEEATYGGAMTRLSRIGADWVGVPVDKDGMRTDALAETLDRLKSEGKRVKYIYTIPTIQNPTGTVMSLDRRKALLEVAETFDLPVFEDDCYADLTWADSRPPAIHALAEPGRVIYCGSFSKSIAPALRVGFIVADWPTLSQMMPLKTDGGTGALEQMVLAEFCSSKFDDHVVSMRSILKAKHDAIVEAVSQEFGTTAEIAPSEGGIFIWVTLPEEVDTSRLAAVAGAEGVAINPGAEWSADAASGRRRMRLCFANPSVEDLREGVAKLAEICHREFGVPTRGGNVIRS